MTLNKGASVREKPGALSQNSFLMTLQLAVGRIRALN
jgi:hypothetical protein